MTFFRNASNPRQILRKEELPQSLPKKYCRKLTGQSLIIPKKIIPNESDFTTKLEEIKERFNLEKNVDLDWKWK